MIRFMVFSVDLVLAADVLIYLVCICCKVLCCSYSFIYMPYVVFYMFPKVLPYLLPCVLPV